MADGSTKYLAEVEANDQVQLYSSATGASSRVATVGRVKIEPRPCLMVEFDVGGGGGDGDGRRAQCFLQQAETVRVAVVAGGEGAAAEGDRGDGDDGGDGGDGSASSHAGEPRPVTMLRPGADFLRVALSSKGTHVGRPIDGSVTER